MVYVHCLNGPMCACIRHAVHARDGACSKYLLAPVPLAQSVILPYMYLQYVSAVSRYMRHAFNTDTPAVVGHVHTTRMQSCWLAFGRSMNMLM